MRRFRLLRATDATDGWPVVGAFRILRGGFSDEEEEEEDDDNEVVWEVDNNNYYDDGEEVGVVGDCGLLCGSRWRKNATTKQCYT